MDREQIKETLRNYLPDYLSSKGININRPFKCLSPDHADNNPSMSYDKSRQRCKCFACGVSYDIFDLIGIDYNLNEFNDIYNKACELYYLKADASRPAERKQAPKKEEPKQEEPKEGIYKKYIRECAARYNGSSAQEYMRKRGISDEVAAAYRIGYEPALKTKNVQEDKQTVFATWEGVVIPTSWDSYTIRNIDGQANKHNRYRKTGVSTVLNSGKRLKNAKSPIFVVEGEIDALSVIEAGGFALGLGSVANVDKLLKRIKEVAPVQPFILCLDADEEGKKAEEKLAQGLEELNITYYRYNITGACKDANEALLLNREEFIKNIKAAEQMHQEAEAAKLEAIRQEYYKTNAAENLQDFLNGITARVNTQAIDTGFNNLNDILDGGLYEGLHIIGAVSALGKTTFVLQIADNVAQKGQDVIIFTLEMARSELMAKSISRLTYLKAKDKRHAKSTRGITSGARWAGYTQEEKQLINSALDAYADYAGHIFIHEGVGNIGVEQIKEEVRKHETLTGNKPVIIVDYLQILAPYDPRATDKQNTDKAVLELKRLSRDYKIPVIGISSFNRDNYLAPVSMASFKESGAIEYSADVLIGLQYAGMDYKGKEGEKDRNTRLREMLKTAELKAKTGQGVDIELKILKNRSGSKGTAFYKFFSMFNYFQESDGAEFMPMPEGAEDPFIELKQAKTK